MLLKTPLHAVDKEMHDRLWDGILQVLAHHIKVGLDKESGDLHLNLFLLTDPSRNLQCLQIRSLPVTCYRPLHMCICAILKQVNITKGCFAIWSAKAGPIYAIARYSFSLAWR